MAPSVAEDQTATVFERFTERARRVMVLAQEEARLLDHGFIGTEHLLLGMIHEGEGVAARALAAHGVTLERARAEVTQILGDAGTPFRGSPPFTPRSKAVLELSLREAIERGNEYLGTEHLLLGLLREGQGVAVHVLATLAGDPADVRSTVLDLLAGGPPGALAAVDSAAVAGDGVPVAPLALIGPEEARALAGGWLAVDSEGRDVELDETLYATRRYRAAPGPELTVAVVGAAVPREAFDAFTARIPDAEPAGGLGDAATWSATRSSLRVLRRTTVFVVRVTGHPDPRAAAVEAALIALANLDAPPPPAGLE